MTDATDPAALPHRRVHEHLVETRQGAVATLRVDREAALGALSTGMVTALGDYFRAIRGSDVRALVITGTGRGFIAGADVAEYRDASQADFDAYQRLSRSVFTELEHLPQPTVAAVNGYAFGGGFELALCCDLIVASTKARFGLPEVKLGLVPGGGGTQRLARAIGTRATKDLIFRGRSMRPEEAERRGLLVQVVEPGDLQSCADELAAELAANAPLAVREAKRLIDDGVQQSLDAALTAEQAALSRLFGSTDGREGIAAFMDKRDPRFTGS